MSKERTTVGESITTTLTPLGIPYAIWNEIDHMTRVERADRCRAALPALHNVSCIRCKPAQGLLACCWTIAEDAELKAALRQALLCLSDVSAYHVDDDDDDDGPIIVYFDQIIRLIERTVHLWQ